jgi:hypothetical protein
MMGSMATTDPITGKPIDDTIGYEDLWPDYKARAVGSNQNLLRSTQRQDMLQLLQASSANPMLMQQVNWGNFARQMFITFGFRNINELLQQLQPGLADQVQSAQGAGGSMPSPQETAMPPGAGNSTELGPLNQLNDMGGNAGVQ